MRFVMTALFAAAVAACGSTEEKNTTGIGNAGSSSSTATTPASGSDAATVATNGSAATPLGSDAAGSGSAVATTGSGSAAGSGTGSDAFDFDKLDHTAQAEFMKVHVVPDMKVAFQTFDAKKFSIVGCKTCHGKDPKAAKFKMPSPDLPKLDFVALRSGKQNPKMAEFMEKTVEPEMAKILHKPVYDPKTNTGFGCLACHEPKK